MVAETLSHDVGHPRTLTEPVGLRATWEARLENRGLRVRFLPGLFFLSLV